jgi:hypothetical protein
MRDPYLLRPEDVPVIDGSFLIPLASIRKSIPPATDPVTLLADMLSSGAPPGLPVLIPDTLREDYLCVRFGFLRYGAATLQPYQHRHFTVEPRLHMSTERINRFSARLHPDHATLDVYTPTERLQEPVATFLRDWILRYVNAR